jgi:hypothetical protein
MANSVSARPKRNLTLKALRSQVTNGKTPFHGDVDLRGPWVRRWQDLLHLHLDDLGDEDQLSEGEKSILRRIATLEVQLEMMESSLARRDGKAGRTYLDLYCRTANSLRRLLETVGLQRRTNRVTLNPLDYAKARTEAEDALA